MLDKVVYYKNKMQSISFRVTKYSLEANSINKKIKLEKYFSMEECEYTHSSMIY